jgi:hypothetical protein
VKPHQRPSIVCLALAAVSRKGKPCDLAFCKPAFAILVGALITLPASLHAQVSATRYEVVDIGALTGLPFSAGLSVSNSGFVAGDGSNGINFSQGFIWRGDIGLRWLNHPSGAGQTAAFEVNDAGQVVGTAAGGVLWNADGSVSHEFPTSVNGLNNAGLVTGTRNTQTSQTAYIWDGSYTDLGIPAPAISSQGYDINDVGQVAGTLNGGQAFDAFADAPTAFLWSAANGFTTITTSPSFSQIGVGDLSNPGMVVGVGYSGSSTANSTAWKWDALTGFSPLSNLPSATRGVAHAVNDSGIIAGSDVVDNSIPFGTLWDEQGNIYKADDLLAPDFSAWRIISLRGINNQGWLTGEALPPGSTNSVAVLLRPIPEPAALPLILLSGASLLTRRRRGV